MSKPCESALTVPLLSGSSTCTYRPTGNTSGNGQSTEFAEDPPQVVLTDKTTITTATFSPSASLYPNQWHSKLFQVDKFDPSGSCASTEEDDDLVVRRRSFVADWLTVSYLTDRQCHSSYYLSTLEEPAQDTIEELDELPDPVTATETIVTRDPSVEFCSMLSFQSHRVSHAAHFQKANISVPRILAGNLIEKNGTSTGQLLQSVKKVANQSAPRQCLKIQVVENSQKNAFTEDLGLYAALQVVLHKHLHRCRIDKTISTYHR